jgi:hypothetical protein
MGFLDKAKDRNVGYRFVTPEKGDRAGEAAKERFQGHDEMIDKATAFGKNYDFGGGVAAERPDGAPAEPGAPAAGAPAGPPAEEPRVAE